MGAIYTNRQLVLVSRPTGFPEESNFQMREMAIPKPKEDEVVVRTLYLSIDPLMRERMSEESLYFPSFELNAPFTGGVVGKVIESKSQDFKPGDFVEGYLDWADYSVAFSKNLK